VLIKNVAKSNRDTFFTCEFSIYSR
jgi:hypothetical protein